MALSAGTRLGPYEISAQIGVGGMGEVYRAKDSKLQRDVAIKVLPADVAQDAERLARFEREARTLAALNHPNIAAIYGLEDSTDTKALVMELVEGPTLADRMAQGAIPVDEALAIAKQIAEALEAAHEQSIIHRDLKPANIKLRPDGVVKVLDFGLAKAMEPTVGSSVSNSMSPTITTPAMTQAGMILGTAAYMSPEQAKGRTVDRRTDVWAFGCVLYEMLSGQRAFGGEDVSETLADVMRVEPAWNLLPAHLSPTLLTFLKRCLAKDPRQRLHDIADMRLALEGAFDTAARTDTAAPPLSRRPLWIPVAAAGLVLAAITGVAGWTLKPAAPVERPIARFAYDVPAGQTFRNTGRAVFALSPDGRRFGYNTAEGLYLRAMDQLEAQLIPGTHPTGLANPFFSPDGQWVGYFQPGPGPGGGQLRKIAITGGAPVTICPATNPFGASWAGDNTIFFAQEDGIHRVSADGGTSELISKVEPGERFDGPQVLPGGTWVLFSITASGNSGYWDEATIVVESLDTKERREVWRGGSDARYVSTGHLVYAVGDTLFAIPFDLATRSVTGGPVALVQGVHRADLTASANYAVSETGSLVYVWGSPGTQRRTLVWVDRQGREEPLDVPERAYAYARLSPDGTRVALDVRDQENDIWIWDVARRTLARLTFDPGLNRSPVWTPDGSRLAFSAQGDAGEGIAWQAADGSGTPEALMQMPNKAIMPIAFSPDGAALLFNETGAPRDITRVALAGERTPEPLLHASFDEQNPEISPDGRWMAYESDESGQPEVYVRPYPNVDTGRWQISTGGGTRPLWNPNGRELFYYLRPGANREGARVMAVPIEPGAAFRAGTPAVVFEGGYAAPNSGRQYSVSPDGRRFLMIKDAAADANAPPPQIIVVQNWVEELKQRAPATTR